MENRVKSGLGRAHEEEIRNYAITLVSRKRMKNFVRSCDAIIDGGGMATGIGWNIYLELSYLLGINSMVHPAKEKEQNYQAFGTRGNNSKVERIVKRCKTLLPIGKGRSIIISVFVVDGDVLFILVQGMLQEHEAL